MGTNLSAYREAFASIIQETLKSQNLWLNDIDYANYMNCHLAEGRLTFLKIEESILRQSLMTSTISFAPSLPRITAFGSLVGKVIHDYLECSPSTKLNVVYNGAIFNNGISLFDRILDDKLTGYQLLQDPKLIDQIKKLLNGEQLEEIKLEGSSVGKELQILLKLIYAFITNCRNLYIKGVNDEVWKEFNLTIKQMYNSEVKTNDLKFNKIGKDKTVEGHLLKVNVIPAWAVALNALLAEQRTFSKNELLGIKEKVLRIGKLFWPMDDLADILEDLKSKTWSMVWLSLYQKGISFWRKDGVLHSDETLLRFLLEEKIIDEMIKHLAKSIDIIDLSKYRNDLLAWTRCWLQVLS